MPAVRVRSPAAGSVCSTGCKAMQLTPESFRAGCLAVLDAAERSTADDSPAIDTLRGLRGWSWREHPVR